MVSLLFAECIAGIITSYRQTMMSMSFAKCLVGIVSR